MKSDVLIQIEEQVTLGNIISHKHKTLPLTIYNYSRTCQYDKKWNEFTLKCRSLVLIKIRRSTKTVYFIINANY
jgi:RNA ligase